MEIQKGLRKVNIFDSKSIQKVNKDPGSIKSNALEKSFRFITINNQSSLNKKNNTNSARSNLKYRPEKFVNQYFVEKRDDRR